MSLMVNPFFEASTGSFCYIVANPESRCCAIIDAPLGVVCGDTVVNTHTADAMLDWIHAHEFVARWILETHVHADRPSAAGYLKSHLLCAKTAIGDGVPNLQGYDQLLGDGEKICLGHTHGRVIATPGHTPGCVSYQFDNAVFVGDTLFMPDTGTARCDFPGGSPILLYKSIEKLLSLPDCTRLYVCHDYPGDRRRNRCVTTVAEQKLANIHWRATTCADSFAALRSQRDRTLAPPRWQAISIPANLQCKDIGEIQVLLTQTMNE